MNLSRFGGFACGTRRARSSLRIVYCRGCSAGATPIEGAIPSVVGGGLTRDDFEVGCDVGRSGSCFSRRSQPHELDHELDQELVQELRQGPSSGVVRFGSFDIISSGSRWRGRKSLYSTPTAMTKTSRAIASIRIAAFVEEAMLNDSVASHNTMRGLPRSEFQNVAFVSVDGERKPVYGQEDKGCKLSREIEWVEQVRCLQQRKTGDPPNTN